MKKRKETLFGFDNDKHEISLQNPRKLPKATGFLWNSEMLLQCNCKGYIHTHYLNDNSETLNTLRQQNTSFLSMRNADYRFFYLKFSDGEIFPLTFTANNKASEVSSFVQGSDYLEWTVKIRDVECILSLQLAKSQPLEIWNLQLASQSNQNIDIYTCFSKLLPECKRKEAKLDEKNACLRSAHVFENEHNSKSHMKEFILASDKEITSYDCNFDSFIGSGDLSAPESLKMSFLRNNNAYFEDSIYSIQQGLELKADTFETISYYFGEDRHDSSSKNRDEGFRERLLELESASFELPSDSIKVSSPVKEFDYFVNFWLQRQASYLANVHRKTMHQPSERYLQDAISNCFLDTAQAKQAILTILSQQESSGVLPEVVNSTKQPRAETQSKGSQSAWLMELVKTYIEQTGDFELLEEEIPYLETKEKDTVLAHLLKALDYCWQSRDSRGLRFAPNRLSIESGKLQWKSEIQVSICRTLSTAYAFKLCDEVLAKYTHLRANDLAITKPLSKHSKKLSLRIKELISSAIQYGWDKDRFTKLVDEKTTKNTSAEAKKLYLACQTLAILSTAADHVGIDKIVKSVVSELDTPFGLVNLAPAYLTFSPEHATISAFYPGVEKNGAIDTQLSTMFAYAMSQQRKMSGCGELVFSLLNKVIPSQNDAVIRGQLPNFIPSQYRGAYRQKPDYAGISSHNLDNGACSWFLKTLVEGLFGLQQSSQGLTIKPILPRDWKTASIQKTVYGANVLVNIQRTQTKRIKVFSHKLNVKENQVSGFRIGEAYTINVEIPE